MDGLAPLCPLRFPRHDETSFFYGILDEGMGALLYGAGIYITGCERFRLVRVDDGGRSRSRWVVEDDDLDHWHFWLDDVGLLSLEASTRREAIECLHAALSADDLLYADAPSPE